MQGSCYPDNLTPAQRRVVDAIREANASVVVEGPRRYTLAGSSLHYKTVEALEARGLLRRDDEQHVLSLTDNADAAPDANTDNADADKGDDVPRPRDDRRQREYPDTAPDANLHIIDDRTTGQDTDRGGLGSLLLEDADAMALEAADDRRTALRAELRADAGSKAREALRRSSAPAERDESIFGWFFRRLEGLFS